MMYLNWYLRYQTIDYDRVSLIFLSRSMLLHIKKAYLTEQTSEHHCTNWESKNLKLTPMRYVWQSRLHEVFFQVG